LIPLSLTPGCRNLQETPQLQPPIINTKFHYIAYFNPMVVVVIKLQSFITLVNNNWNNRWLTSREEISTWFSWHSSACQNANKINQLINHSINHPINQSINQSVNHPTNQSINWSINQLPNQSINQSFSQSINQSNNQPIKQPITQSTNPPIYDNERNQPWLEKKGSDWSLTSPSSKSSYKIKVSVR